MSDVQANESFLVELALSLHKAGAPAHRLEDRVAEAAAPLGVKLTCFATPTSVFVVLGERVRLLRVEPEPLHLERLVAVDRIAVEVGLGKLDAVTGLARLRVQAPERYPHWLRVLCLSLASASAAVFFEGTLTEVGIAAGMGLLVGLWSTLCQAYPKVGRLFELTAAFGVAALATLLSRQVPISVWLVTLAGLIVLLPGLSLTVALTELATRHLTSGTSRLAGASVTFLQLGVGTALGWRIADLLPKILKAPRTTLPEWTLGLALLISGFCYLVLLKARPRDAAVIIPMAFLAFFAARGGALLLGPELGACVAGLLVGLAGNLQARIRDLPSAVGQIPGLLVLVPGSLGFQGFRAMLQDDVEGGVGAAFSMLVVAGSLVTGMLAAGVLLPPRRAL